MDKPQRHEVRRDDLIRDIPLIQRYSRNNEREDVNFRNHLKFYLNVSNRELDATVQGIAEEVWSGIDCLACAHCCKTMQVEVNPTDIARLAAHLQMSKPAFIQRYVRTAEEDNAKVINSVPCPFLGEDNRCTVYEHRPESCRGYPYVNKPDFRNRSFFIMENLSVCPITFNVWQRLKTRYGRRRSNRR